MNKEEILNTLEKYDLDKSKYTIISSAAMVLNDIKKETKDIDITVSEKYEKELLKKYRCKIERKIEDNGKIYTAYLIDDIINFSVHYHDEYKCEKKYNLNIQIPEEILKLKYKLGRDKDQNDIKLLKNHIKKKETNALSLAYLGDAVYELYIRMFLIKANIKVKDMQEKSIEYVSAKAQSNYLNKMIQSNFLTQQELEIVKRGRNHKSHKSKSSDIITYKKSTGLECLIGYLKIMNNNDRIEEIMNFIVGDKK